MNGFITESVSKISDGFGSALKLMAFMLITTFALIPIKSLFGLTGIVVLLLILVLLSAFYLHRSVRNKVEDSQKAWYGMAAGVLLWQVTRYLPEIPGLGWLDRIGFLYWTLLALVTLLLWKRVLPIGLRFLLLAFLLNWIGRLYIVSLETVNYGSGIIPTVYPYLRYLGLAGMMVNIWWIVTRSRNSIERKYGGLALYFCAMLTFLFF